MQRRATATSLRPERPAQLAPSCPSPDQVRGRAACAPPQDFLPGGLKAWPVLPCDFLYSETELFGSLDFGFLASLLPLI
jgi:hypothetical protein